MILRSFKYSLNSLYNFFVWIVRTRFLIAASNSFHLIQRPVPYPFRSTFGKCLLHPHICRTYELLLLFYLILSGGDFVMGQTGFYMHPTLSWDKHLTKHRFYSIGPLSRLVISLVNWGEKIVCYAELRKIQRRWQYRCPEKEQFRTGINQRNDFLKFFLQIRPDVIWNK